MELPLIRSIAAALAAFALVSFSVRAEEAAKAAAALTGLGYKATVTAQTPGYNFTENDIEYAPNAKAPAQQLQA